MPHPPPQVEKQGCGFTSIGCNAIIRYSFANEAAHDQYQVGAARRHALRGRAIVNC